MEPVRGKATSKTKVVRHQRKVPKKEICKRMGPDSAKQEFILVSVTSKWVETGEAS